MWALKVIGLGQSPCKFGALTSPRSALSSISYLEIYYTQVQKAHRISGMMASATLNLARGYLYQHHSTVPRSKSPAFSNPKPFHCDFIVGNGKLTVNNATTLGASNPRRRFSCTSNLAEYAQTTSAVYGFLLLSGGFFACKLLISSIKTRSFFFFFFFQLMVGFRGQLLEQEAKGHYSAAFLGQL